MHELRRIVEALRTVLEGRRDLSSRQLSGRVLFVSSSVAGCGLGFGLDPEIAFVGMLSVSAFVVLVDAISRKT
jgi:hypothetical protein